MATRARKSPSSSTFSQRDVQPEIIVLTNVLLSGIVPSLRAHLNAPLLGVLQGDDVFLEMLPDKYRRPALDLIRANSEHFAGFIATSHYYADFMAGYVGLPRDKIQVIHPGLNLKGFAAAPPSAAPSPFTIGYFARICPEKGLHNLVAAFQILLEKKGPSAARLKISGWLGDNQRHYLDGLMNQLHQRGQAGAAEYVSTPDHAAKVRFYQSIDVLSVPTTYHEPKGLYVLEALASGVPVVQPRHGSFPELIEATGGGLLVNPNDPNDLATAFIRLLDNPAQRTMLAQKGQLAVQERFHAGRMAQETVNLFRKLLP